MKNYIKFLLKISGGTAAVVISLSFCGIILLIISIVCIKILASGATSELQPELSYKTISGEYASTNKFLSIPITGLLLGNSDEAGGSFFTLASDYTAGYAVKKLLYQAVNDATIKGVMLEINSPGGVLYGAHAITDGVLYYKTKTHKPVIAFISGLGASAAYWSAISADYVFADYGSEVADIGVIYGPFFYYDKVTAMTEGLLSSGIVTQNGIKSTYITAGKSKDLGNPFRKLSSSEVATLQKTVDDNYHLFVRYVSKRRNIPENVIQDTIGALPYGNDQAIAYHLIDATMGKEDAYAFLAKKAGIRDGSFKIVSPTKNIGFLTALLQGSTKTTTPKLSNICTTAMTLSYYGDITKLCQ